MSTTIDDLIALKDYAVEFAFRVAADADAPSGLRISAQSVIDSSELYDLAEGDESVVSVESYERHRQAIGELRAAGWYALADDLAEGVPVAVLEGRLRRLQLEADPEEVGAALEILGAL